MIKIADRLINRYDSIIGLDSPELNTLSANKRILSKPLGWGIDKLQEPYNYLPRTDRFDRIARQKTQIAAKIQNPYYSSKSEMYNLTNAGIVEDMIQTLSSRVAWKERVDYVEKTLEKYGDALGSVELYCLINSLNECSQHTDKYRKLANADYVRNKIKALTNELEEKHKSVSYKEATLDLEEKALAPQKTYLLNERGGVPKSAYFKITGAIVLAALISTPFIGWYKSEKNAMASKNKAESLEATVKTLKTGISDISEKYNKLETTFDTFLEKYNDLNTKVAQLEAEKTAAEDKAKQAAEEKEQKAEQIKIPVQGKTQVQGNGSLKTNFTFRHKTEDSLKLYSPKERYALERIATAMDYKDPTRALKSLKRAENAVNESGNQTMISFYNGYFTSLTEVIDKGDKQGDKQNPLSDDEKYGLLFRTIPPSQQPGGNAQARAKPLEAKVEQEKAKKTIWQKTGDIIWGYTPISLLSIPEWKRNTKRQVIKAVSIVGTYYIGKWAGWWKKHGGEAASAGGDEDGGPGLGSAVFKLFKLLKSN